MNNIMNTQLHPRSKIIHIQNECGEWDIRFNIFHKEYKLRCHVVKHFFDKYERKQLWSEYTSKSYDAIIKELKNINCPYYRINVKKNKNLCAGCPNFDKCSETGIKEAQEDYIDCIERLLDEVVKKPRFVNYYSRGKIERYFTAIHDRKVKILGKFNQDEQAYDILTAFLVKTADKTMKFAETLAQLVEIIIDMSKGTPEWCNEKMWAIMKNATENPISTKKKTPYFRSTEKFSWRKHYNNEE